MSTRCFCTIITRSHLPWALALAGSLRQHEPELPFHILITDLDPSAKVEVGAMGDITIVRLSDVMDVSVGRALAAKYADRSDELRWTMKPVLMEYLHQRYEKVAYGDCDLHFFTDHTWLWEELDRSVMLLTPHWRSSRAAVDRANFDLLFVEGLYNAGFVAAHRKASSPLRRWAENCLEVCVKDAGTGQFVDQTHLNVLPIYFEGVVPLKHRGCNVANWNMVECPRSLGPDGEVRIQGSYPVVFIHFTRSMIDGITSGVDALLLPHLTTLRDRLIAHGLGRDIIAGSRERQLAPPVGVRTRIGRAVKRIMRLK